MRGRGRRAWVLGRGREERRSCEEGEKRRGGVEERRRGSGS